MQRLDAVYGTQSARAVPFRRVRTNVPLGDEQDVVPSSWAAITEGYEVVVLEEMLLQPSPLERE